MAEESGIQKPLIIDLVGIDPQSSMLSSFLQGHQRAAVVDSLTPPNDQHASHDRFGRTPAAMWSSTLFTRKSENLSERRSAFEAPSTYR